MATETNPLFQRLRNTRFCVRLVMMIERLWPLLLPLILVIVLFATVSWYGLFRIMPDWARYAVAAIFAIAALASLYPLSRFRKPNSVEIDHRIEQANTLRHRPISTQSDRPASQGHDPLSEALWREHQRRMAEGIDRLEIDTPRTGVPARDPLALRAIPALLLVTAFAYSFSPSGGTLSDVVSARGGAPAIPPRIDAWVTPPAYTGHAPVFLTADASRNGSQFTVPQGSRVILRINGGSGDQKLTYTSQDTASANILEPDTSSDGNNISSGMDKVRQFSFTLEKDGLLALSVDQQPFDSWAFRVIPDQPPEISLKDEPKGEPSGAFNLSYTVKDDYGAASAEALFELAEQLAPDARTLYNAPDIPLTLPRNRQGDSQTRIAKPEHPWAGAAARLRLKVTDAAGQEGISTPLEMFVPARSFTDSLARAIIEQRRILALDANRKPRVLLLLDAVTLRPEDTFNNMSHYLGLMALRTRLKLAQSDEALRESVDYMWELAVQIEDGGLTDAQRRLRDAQQALRDALENGASDEEIERRMAELRDAMNEFMRELAEQAQQNPDMAQQMPQDMQQLDQTDLEKMLQKLEELAKSGQREQAEQLLSQLENMMRNLQAGRQHQGQQQSQQGQMQQQMNRLGELMRRQQEMMNETFQLEQLQRGQQQGQQDQNGQEGENGQQQGQGNGGMSPEELAEALRGLQEGQGQLQGELGEFMEGLRGMGIEPGQGFGQAQDRMGEAGQALGEADGEQAVGRQGEALEALRQGAQDMMNQMQQQARQNGQGGSEPGGDRRADDRDPLGRPRATTGPDFGDTVKVPDEIDAQRAREILDAIRKRLGNALSPQLEKEYLERLLDLQ